MEPEAGCEQYPPHVMKGITEMFASVTDVLQIYSAFHSCLHGLCSEKLAIGITWQQKANRHWALIIPHYIYIGLIGYFVIAARQG